MLTYQELIQQMNQSMLAAEPDRVGLLCDVLDQLDHPEKQYQIMHIVGTNGKGSTGTLIGNLLINTGEKVGHFASPAIHNDREQIQLQNKMISETDFVSTYEKIIGKLTADFKMNQLSIFEWFVIIMLQYFADQGVSWAIIEAGLGGKYDATNAISAPIITIVTHVDLDHTMILGNTIKKIAYNKSDVIKPNTTVFLAPRQSQDTKNVVEQRIVERHAQSLIDTEYVDIKIDSETTNGFDLEISSHELRQTKVHLGMLGEFQLDNLKTVISLYDWLIQDGYVSNNNLIGDILKLTLSQTKIAGRMQIIQQQPTVILDAAHNPDSTKRLIESLKRIYPNQKLKFVLGFLQDKNYLEMAHLYEAVADEIVVVTPDNLQRAIPAVELHEVITNSKVVDNAQIGLSQLLTRSNLDDVIIVTGSFYTIKEVEIE
ncbi:folylpolyglutamate synthase [Paucilactobacillus oligofermentans DSM 15707 = LMG 22743]|uniref:tetrahydrofolate synthase n=1 Tax=Paucilactobacillus oligofermentans DSM 15707 = LMG 22743 TaxID=1423778 RepID=A0A0R1RH26_9LACO|nr:cyanophycin synthetase [Paucilactobacillus oligofermentans]KRL56028.1 folylpolyglutamate synthase [Paucilactobacillus oligofermentans DSM 15707 = LMG 22743]CUS25989.1 Putative tetrahydrofolate synthase [Paucilactobacillus oligofermentans DSM 15707 = LMG 22743]